MKVDMKKAFARAAWSVALGIVASTSNAFGASGIFQTFVITNTGAGNTYYDTEITASGFNTGNSDWGGFNLGTFDASGSVGGTGTLLLNGAEVKTFKNSGSDVTGASLSYRIYRQGSTAPGFTATNLPFGANLGGGGDQRWESTGLGFNTLSGRDAGVHNFEVFHSATANFPTQTHFINNGGANFIATFTINTGTFLWDGGAGNASTSSANNWSNNIAPGNRHNIQFAGATQTSVTNAFTDVNSITFNSGASAFTVSGAALNVAGGGVTNNSGSAQTVSANLTNTAANTYSSGSAAGGSLTVSGTVNNSGNLLTVSGSNPSSFSGSISGSGGLTKTGTGTATLSASNSYSGPTNVSQGQLSLATTGSITSTATVSVSTGATLQVDGSITSSPFNINGTLSGSGTVNGTTNVFGTLAPGNSVDPTGQLNVGGPLAMGSLSATELQIDASTAGNFDRVNVSSSLIYNGTLKLNFTSALSVPTSIDFFDFTSQSGTFNAVDLSGAYVLAGIVPGPTGWTAITGGTVFTFSNVTGVLNLSAVPEPLTAASVLMLAGRVLGRRSRASL